jgi:putative inorganic carbon (hco3(-)) transporter
VRRYRQFGLVQELATAGAPGAVPVASEASQSPPVSWWFLLAFLILLYANTPFILPALEVVHPAKVIAGLTLLAVLTETLSGRRRFEFPWPEGGWLILFLVAAASSCTTALWPGYAVDALSDLVKMVLIYFVLIHSAASEKMLRGVMWVMIAGGLFPALGTLHNYAQGNMEEGRAAWVGIFANPNEVAYSLVILLPLAAYLASRHGWKLRMVLLGISLVYLAALFVTFSRGGLIGLAAATAVYAWRKRSVWLSVSLGIVIAAGLGIAGQYWTRGEDFSNLNNDLSFQERIATSQAGVDMFVDHPVLGVGLKCSVIAWPLYAPPGLHTRGALITHNTFVQLLSETGILGAIPFLLFIGTGLYHARQLAVGRRCTDLGIAVECSIWGFVICGMSGGYIMTWFPYILMGLAAAARRIAKEMPAQETSESVNRENIPEAPHEPGFRRRRPKTEESVLSSAL